MRSTDSLDTPKVETSRRASLSFSIVIDDYDSKNANSKDTKSNSETQPQSPKVYTRKNSDASIKKLLEEAEQRKHDFWKLIDEHSAVIEDLKRIEKLEHNVCKSPQSPIRT